MADPDPRAVPAPTLADWHRAAAKGAPGGDADRLVWTTPEGIPVKALKESVK